MRIKTQHNFKKNLRIYFYFMSMSVCLHVCLYTTCVPDTPEESTKFLGTGIIDSYEPPYHVGSENWIQLPWKNSQCYCPLFQLSIPGTRFFFLSFKSWSCSSVVKHLSNLSTTCVHAYTHTKTIWSLKPRLKELGEKQCHFYHFHSVHALCLYRCSMYTYFSKM